MLKTYFLCKDDNNLVKKQMLSVQKDEEDTTEKYFKTPTQPSFSQINAKNLLSNVKNPEPLDIQSINMTEDWDLIL